MKKIKFNRIVNFLGRNGLFKAAGIQASITVNPSAETTVWLEPIRQDEGIGRAILQMPVDHIPELVEYLNSVHRQHGGGELYVEVGKRYADRFGTVWEVLSIDTSTPNNPYPITAKATDKALLEYFNSNGHNPTSYAYQLMYQVGE